MDVVCDSLFNLAINAAVKHANLLQQYSSIIPPVLYHSLLLAAIKTNRVLSVRSLLLSWPLKELCLTNYADFTPVHASMMAHCFQVACPKLCVVDLSWCNTGVQGTKLFLMLAAGRKLPKAKEYGTGSEQDQKTSTAESDILAPRFHLRTDCYINHENFSLFMEVLDNLTQMCFTVSCLHAIELGTKRIKRLLKKMTVYHAEFVTGLNFEMNGLSCLEISSTGYCNLQTKQEQKSSPYCFGAFNSFSNLKYLNLSGNIIGWLVIIMILRNLANNACLTHLFLNLCNIGPKKDIEQMSECKCIQKLEHLELANNRLGSVHHLFNTFLKCSQTLVSLNLERNGLKQDSLPTIQKLLKAPFNLKRLRISKNKFSSDDLKQLHNPSCEIC